MVMVLQIHMCILYEMAVYNFTILRELDYELAPDGKKTERG